MSKSFLIVTDFYEPHISGIVTYINKLIDSLQRKNYEVTVLTTKHNIKLKKIESINKVNIIRCKPTIKISRGFFSLELVSRFLKIHKDYDYVNIHLPLVEIFPIVFFLNKKKTIINYHCLPEFPFHLKFIRFYFYLFGIFAILKSKFLIVLSKDYFNKFLFHKLFNKNLIELPPYISLPKLKNLNKKFNKKIIFGDTKIRKDNYIFPIIYEDLPRNNIINQELIYEDH